MKILIIGAVAAGTKAAAKIMRQDPFAQVEIFSRGKDISYAGCGLPYYVGGEIESREDLVIHSPAKFSALTGASVHTGSEAVQINALDKRVLIRDITEGTEQWVSYDRLIFATGAVPFVPDIPGKEKSGVFTVRTPDDAGCNPGIYRY